MERGSKTGNSYQLYESSKELVTGGVHSGFRYREPHPIYFARANGSRVWDLDGNEYIDCLVGNGSCILGHGNIKVHDSVRAQLQTGLTVGLESELSIDIARLLHQMIPSAQTVKLSNTGTEAVMHAFQIARGYTHKKKIVKTEGSYHGWQDEVSVGVHPKVIDEEKEGGFGLSAPETDGLSPSALENMAIVPYNNADAFERYSKDNKNDIAAMIVEPVLFNSGCILPNPNYLQELREITEKHGILLIFDEIITGFRLAPGGAQQFYKVTPDISVFGKAIANGFPLSAVVGDGEIMAVTKPKTGNVTFAGTYNANQISLAAANACLEQLRDGKIQKKISDDCALLRKRFDELKSDSKLKVINQTIGGQFQIYFTEAERITDYRSAAKSDQRSYAIFSQEMFSSGTLFHQSFLFHHGVSFAHNEEDLARVLLGFKKGLDQVALRS